MTKLSRLLITPGEPAGIGPDITIQLAQKSWPVELVAIADPDLLIERAQLINLPLQLIECDFKNPPTSHQPGILKIFPVQMETKAEPGKLNPANAHYVIRTLEIAAAQCHHKQADAVVTGPVHKGVINQAGTPFTGHTEFFAAYCHVAKTVMLFVVASQKTKQDLSTHHQLRVALATTHLPLKEVSSAITQEQLQQTLSILHHELIQKFHITSPRILICGLNPHAGEGGYLGREEIDIITPVIDTLRKQHYHLTGPLPADTLFTPKYLQQADVVLAMYHDQALPLVKYIGFGHAVNVTLGLPFIRTSVDHGTALDVAGTTQVDASSMMAAVQLAIEMGTK